MKAQAKILGSVHEKYHIIMRASNDLARLHICAVLPEPWLIVLKRRVVNKGSGQIVYTSSCDLGTYRICEQRKTRRACTIAQSRQIMFEFLSSCE